MQESTWTISDLIEALPPDPWRMSHPFSQDMGDCHAILFDSARTRAEKLDAITEWLASFQPCLFGRMEAKRKRLAYCLLTDHDLERSDQEIQERIAEDRQEWKRLGLKGQNHAFLILAVSRRIADAPPGEALLRLAARLCELYLGFTDTGKIFLDDLILEINSPGRVEWRTWKVGVNYFSAQGDGRWWHDHRIPGGMAFSMNSVGHMARTQAEQAMARDAELAGRWGEVAREKLVYWALPKAMRTIGPRHESSTRGTWLAERGSFPEDKEPPTYNERHRAIGDLAAYSENRYRGLYHTDETIPSPYFDPSLDRREVVPVREDLFFTYLHQRKDDDYLTMGLGKEIEHAE
jgi:hypothetical protein